MSYGVRVATTDESFAWRELGADVGGGAAGGAVPGACVGGTGQVALCGAASAATSSFVGSTISGTRQPEVATVAFDAAAGLVVAGSAGALINRLPALSGLRINSGWFTPSNASSVWNPGAYARRVYGSNLFSGMLGVAAEVGNRAFRQRGAPC